MAAVAPLAAVVEERRAAVEAVVRTAVAADLTAIVKPSCLEIWLSCEGPSRK
jgi:hypothetical protein